MKIYFIIILSQIMAPKAASEQKPRGGARGKTAVAVSNAAEDSGTERIMGGDEASPHEFPFQLLLLKGNVPQCGAVIIDTEWALSAGHCAGPGAVKQVTLWAGKHDKTIPESTEQIVAAVEIVKHEDYAIRPLRNDIIAIKVSPPFQFNEYVQRVALPLKSDEKYSTGMATTVGWGTTKTESGFNTTTLQKVSLPLMTNERCKELLEKPDSIFPSHICAGSEVVNKSACYGDSGGPLVVKEDGRQVLIGTTSWGIICGYNNTPTVFTRITEFLEWIENTTGLDLSSRGDRRISVGDTSGGLAGTEEVVVQPAVRAKISNGLVQTMCKGFDDYKKGKKMAPAVKVRPSKNTPDNCVWANWSRCKEKT